MERGKSVIEAAVLAMKNIDIQLSYLNINKTQGTAMTVEPINNNVLIRKTDKDGFEPLPGSGIQVKSESKWNDFCKGEIVFIPSNDLGIKAGDKVFYARAITVPARDEILVNKETLIVKKLSDIVGRVVE